MIVEKAVTFGPDRSMVGILTEAQAPRPELPLLVFLNAGLLHRVGPYRMHVDLGRRLAGAGYRSFRFDLRGRGDSAPIGSDAAGEDSAIADIRSALDYLAAQGKGQRFVLLGLCTGADHSHRGAVADERVVGTVMLDGYGYPTARFYLRRYVPVLLSPGRLFRAVCERMSAPFKRRGQPVDIEAGVEQYLWELPDKSVYRQELETLIDRGVHMLYVYSAGVALDYYNYTNQFFDALKGMDFRQQVTVQRFQRADHEYTLLEDRRQLFDTVSAWLDTCFGGRDTST